jgi:hypothetical protein
MYEWYTAHTYAHIYLYIYRFRSSDGTSCYREYILFLEFDKKKYLLAIGANRFVQKYAIQKSTGL